MSSRWTALTLQPDRENSQASFELAQGARHGPNVVGRKCDVVTRERHYVRVELVGKIDGTFYRFERCIEAVMNV